MQRGASVAHKVIKCWQKDATKNYETAESQLQAQIGVSTEERMASRMVTWAAGKWQAHSTADLQGLQEAMALLKEALRTAPPLPHLSMKQLKRVLNSFKAGGLGIDAWVVQLWSYLPEEALKILLTILQAMDRGVMPVQTLLSSL